MQTRTTEIDRRIFGTTHTHTSLLNLDLHEPLIRTGDFFAFSCGATIALIGPYFLQLYKSHLWHTFRCKVRFVSLNYGVGLRNGMQQRELDGLSADSKCEFQVTRPADPRVEFKQQR